MTTRHTYSVHLAGNRQAPQGAPENIYLDAAAFTDVNTLGEHLRSVGVLPKGSAIKSAVQVGHHWTITPRSKRGVVVQLTRTDLWTVIGRGKAGWHAKRGGCSSSGGTLESISGVTNDYLGSGPGKPWHRAGYLADAAEGCKVYDADGADYAAYARHVLCGPMLDISLPDDGVNAFGKESADAARRMMPGLSGGFEVLAADAIAHVEQPRPGRKYGSLDHVGWGIFRGLLEAVGNVRFGEVRNGRVVWE